MRDFMLTPPGMTLALGPTVSGTIEWPFESGWTFSDFDRWELDVLGLRYALPPALASQQSSAAPLGIPERGPKTSIALLRNRYDEFAI
jgi:hypothetical protein